MRQIKKMAQRGLLDPEQEDPFSLFVASTDIRYCYYNDTHKILGNTFGMCVLQVSPIPAFSSMPQSQAVKLKLCKANDRAKLSIVISLCCLHAYNAVL